MRITAEFFILLLTVLQPAASLYAQQQGEKYKDPTARIVIVDSDLTFEESVAGKEIPDWILAQLTLIDVFHIGYDGLTHKGQLVVNSELAAELEDIFKDIYQSGFPIERVCPVVFYDWSDSLSMADNNTSCFNYRVVQGSRVLSYHATGKAVDINPLYNPWIRRGVVVPEGSEYNPGQKGTITHGDPVVTAFGRRGWIWGGYWGNSKDYQHFYKK